MGICGLIILVLFCTRKYEYKAGTAEDPEGGFVYKVPFTKKDEYYIVFLCAVAICFYVGIEANSFAFLPTFVIGVLDGDKDERTQKGADLSAAMGFAFAFGRGAAIFMAMKLKSRNILFLDVVLLLTASGVFYLTKTMTVLWIGSLLLGKQSY